MHSMFENPIFPAALILSYFFDLYIMAITAMIMLKRRFSIVITLLSVIAGWYICLFPLHFDNAPTWTNSILLVLYLFWPVIMFKDSFIKKFFNGILSAFVLLFADLSASLIIVNVFGKEVLSPTEYGLKTVYYIICPIYYLIFVLCWNKFVNKKNILSGKMLPFWVFTVGEIGFILSLTFIYTIIWDFVSLRLKTFLLTLIVMFIILFVVFEFIIFYVSKKSEKYQKLQSDYKMLEYQSKLQTEYYTKIQENIESTAKIRHDINNIVSIIKIQLSENTAESRQKAEELTNEIYKIMKSTDAHKYCDNRIVNTVLFDKDSIAKKENIKLCDEVILSEQTGIENFDLCRVFVNLLDNAINALVDYDGNDNKTIFISCKENDGFLYIKTENPYSEEKTNQKKHDSSGYGLIIINDIANKYQGAFATKKENGRFKTLLTLKTQ